MSNDKIITDIDMAAVAVGWELAHNEMCDMGVVCSRHQSVAAQAQRTRVVYALLNDSDFMELKGRDFL